MTGRRVVFFVALTAVVYACGSEREPGVVEDAGVDGAAPPVEAATPRDSARPPLDAPAVDGAVPVDSAPAPDAADAATWPDCLARPAAAPATTIDGVWTANAAAPTQVWIAGAHVTAVSRGGCNANQACQIYLQEGTTYASLADGAHKALKVFVSSNASSYFTGLAVGDKVDTLGWGWRATFGGQNEILVQVAQTLPGCMRKTGTATLTPIRGVALSALTRASYETYGPLLVQVSTVLGRPPASATETFGLFTSGFDGSTPDGGANIVSLSPFFLPGAAFTNPPVVPSAVNAFATLTGVFGTFTPSVDGGTAITYLELYPRTIADITK